MADINLIPNDYRDWMRRQSVLKHCLVGYALGVIVIAFTAFSLTRAANQAEELAADLKSQNAIAQQQRLQLDLLDEQRGEYERQWSLLRGLRAGAAVEDIFQIVDRSILGGNLWFTDWTFRRAGVVVDGEQRERNTGYIIIKSGNGQDPSDTGWQVETHMSISGQAYDHQAISTFVRSLFEQPDVTDVSVSKTSMTTFAERRVVDFDITVILNSALREDS